MTPHHQKAPATPDRCHSPDTVHRCPPGGATHPHPSPFDCSFIPASTLPECGSNSASSGKSPCQLHLQVGKNVLFLQYLKHMFVSLMPLGMCCSGPMFSSPWRGCQGTEAASPTSGSPLGVQGPGRLISVSITRPHARRAPDTFAEAIRYCPLT